MAFDLSAIQQSSAVKKPARIVVHGVQGIGKTSFASRAPAPIFLPTEDGLASVDVPTFPQARSFEDVMEALVSLYQEDHPYQTLVVDSLDWMEPLVNDKACRDNGWTNIEQPGFGKGYVAALSVWQQYIDGVNALRNDKGMWIVQIAHNEIKRHEPPETDPYDRYIIKLYKRASEKLVEHADVVMFLNYQTSIKTVDKGFNNKGTRAIGSGQRIIYTAERPAFWAKNRYSMPPEMRVNENQGDPLGTWDPVWQMIHEHVGV